MTFIDSSDEEMNTFPEANFANVKRNAYGRPTQRECPMPRQREDVTRDTNPTIPSQASAFTAYVAPQQRAVDSNVRPIQQASYLLMPVPFYPNGWNSQGFGSFSHNTLSLPPNSASTHNGPKLQMNPPVMPEVAGYCSGCMKTYDQIAVETLTSYVAWSEYPEENSGSKCKVKSLCGWIGSSVDLF